MKFDWDSPQAKQAYFEVTGNQMPARKMAAPARKSNLDLNSPAALAAYKEVMGDGKTSLIKEFENMAGVIADPTGFKGYAKDVRDKGPDGLTDIADSAYKGLSYGDSVIQAAIENILEGTRFAVSPFSKDKADSIAKLTKKLGSDFEDEHADQPDQLMAKEIFKIAMLSALPMGKASGLTRMGKLGSFIIKNSALGGLYAGAFANPDQSILGAMNAGAILGPVGAGLAHGVASLPHAILKVIGAADPEKILNNLGKMAGKPFLGGDILQSPMIQRAQMWLKNFITSGQASKMKEINDSLGAKTNQLLSGLRSGANPDEANSELNNIISDHGGIIKQHVRSIYRSLTGGGNFDEALSRLADKFTKGVKGLKGLKDTAWENFEKEKGDLGFDITPAAQEAKGRIDSIMEYVSQYDFPGGDKKKLISALKVIADKSGTKNVLSPILDKDGSKIIKRVENLGMMGGENALKFAKFAAKDLDDLAFNAPDQYSKDQLRGVSSSLRKAITSSVEKNGTARQKELWEQANKIHREQYSKLLDPDVEPFVGDIDKLNSYDLSRKLGAGKISGNPTMVKKLLGIAGDNAKKDILAQHFGDNETSYKKMIDNYEKMAPESRKLLLNNEQDQSLKALKDGEESMNVFDKYKKREAKATDFIKNPHDLEKFLSETGIDGKKAILDSYFADSSPFEYQQVLNKIKKMPDKSKKNLLSSAQEKLAEELQDQLNLSSSAIEKVLNLSTGHNTAPMVAQTLSLLTAYTALNSAAQGDHKEMFGALALLIGTPLLRKALDSPLILTAIAKAASKPAGEGAKNIAPSLIAAYNQMQGN